MLSLMKRTEPSARAALTPPGWKLRDAADLAEPVLKSGMSLLGGSTAAITGPIGTLPRIHIVLRLPDQPVMLPAIAS